MKLEIDIPKHQYNNIMTLDSINLGRAPYKGIIMYAINAIKRGKALEQGPILDKIRAEIEQITDTMGVSYNQYVSKIDVLQILDKYNEETEKT